MKKKRLSSLAVYPGSFDPITLGHIDIIERISKLYDQVIVLISENPHKKGLFTSAEKRKLIESSLAHLKNIQIDRHSGLTVNYLKEKKSQVLVRGLRAVVDFEYEMTMASLNKKLAPEIETVIIFASPELYFISSRGVKEIAALGGALKGLVPEIVEKALIAKTKKGSL